MNNLKRILSLALASVMVMGMMVVGASATDYVDDEKIVNKEAVETLAALGIMNGDDRGFRPEDGLTRAEAAKMLAKIHNKGRDVTYGAKDIPTFTDIKGHWAEDNIEYAAAFGIANGKGNGIFDPQGSLTVVQLARMTLNMMGYTEGQTGSDWELQTTVLADDLGLFANLDGFIPTANVTRDQAAQILVNAIDKPMEGSEVVVTNVYRLTDAAGADLGYGTFTSAADAQAFATGNGLKDYKIARGENRTSESLGTKYLSLKYDTSSYVASVKADSKGTYTVTLRNGNKYTGVKKDYSDLMGQNVNVLYKASNNVYGITAVGAVVYEGTVGDYAASGDDKALINAATIYDFNDFESTKGTIAEPTAGDEQSLKVILNGRDANGRNIYLAVTTPVTLSTVTNVTSKTATVRGMAALEIGKEIALNGAVKGDTVLVTSAVTSVSGMVELAKAEIKEAVAADAYRTVSGVDQVRVNGEWLTVLDEDDFDILKAMTKNATYDLVMVNGYVASQSLNTTATEPTDLLVLTQVAKTATAGLNTYVEARAYFVKDGSTAVIKLPAPALKENETVADYYAEGTLNAYTEKDGLYTLTAPNAKALGYTDKTTDDAGVVVAAGKNNTIDSKLIAEDAVIVTFHQGATANAAPVVEVVTGKAARNWSTGFGGNGSVAFTDKVNGVDYVKFAFLADSSKPLPDATGKGADYGYIVTVPYTTSAGTVFSIWTGTETIEVTDDSKLTLSRGEMIQYATKDNGVITASKLDKVTAGAITGIALNDELITLANVGEKKVTENTAIIYVDSAKFAGQETGTLELADLSTTNPGQYTPNVKYLLGGTNNDTVLLLVVDVTNSYAREDKVETSFAGKDAARAYIENLPDGTYNYTNKTPLVDDMNTKDTAKNIVFKFTVSDHTKATKLEIKDKDGKLVYDETAGANKWSTDAGHFFIIDASFIGCNSNGSLKLGDAMEAGTYTATVTNNDKTILVATFIVED